MNLLDWYRSMLLAVLFYGVHRTRDFKSEEVSCGKAYG